MRPFGNTRNNAKIYSFKASNLDLSVLQCSFFQIDMETFLVSPNKEVVVSGGNQGLLLLLLLLFLLLLKGQETERDQL